MRKKGVSKFPSAPFQVHTLTPEEELELDFEVSCCIEEIENVLSKNCTEKQKKLAEISLNVLKNPGDTFIKKKQVMRQWFGDYKKQFAPKKKQTLVSLNENKCNFKKVETPLKSVYFRKHKNFKQADLDSGSLKSTNDKEEHCNFNYSANSFKFEF